MTLPLVAVGIGNTTIKFGVTAHATRIELPCWSARQESPTQTFQPAELTRLLGPTRHGWLVASVQRAAEQRLRDWVTQARPADEYRLLDYRELPLAIDVEAPDRVGMDRLAAAVAANRLRDPGRPAVVVDAGTALTVNILSADGVFRGGAILPGFRLTAQALAERTDLLPLVTADLTAEPPPVVGRSTEAAIRSGMFWGSVGAVRELIARAEQQLSGVPQVFVTGGDAQRLAGFLAADARFIPDLVLIGIVSSVLTDST